MRFIKASLFLSAMGWCSLSLFILLALSSCGTDYREKLAVVQRQTTADLTQLKQALQAGRLRNAEIVKSYAATLAEKKPDLKKLAVSLASDATPAGTPYQGLVSRLKAVSPTPSNENAFRRSLAELEGIQLAADTAVFNDAMLDIANTLADLSDGLLPRINIPKSAKQDLLSQKRVAGSYLVGNPSYGRWRNDSRGSSFWEWYGKYSLFRSVFSGSSYSSRYHSGHVYSRDWYERPRYSYYHDYGRQSYGTRSDRTTWGSWQSQQPKSATPTAAPKDYRSVAGRKRMSTYASTHRTSTKSSSYSNTASKPSSAGRTSSYSQYSSSSRGTSSGSRSARSGK